MMGYNAAQELYPQLSHPPPPADTRIAGLRTDGIRKSGLRVGSVPIGAPFLHIPCISPKEILRILGNIGFEVELKRSSRIRQEIFELLG